MTVKQRYLSLLALRWLATGLIIPVSLLLPLSRGMTVTQVAGAMAAQGVVVLLLEIPSGVLTDVWGRRPVFVASAVAALAAYGLMILADSVLLLTVAWALKGVFRALDSGPLEAWFVDAENARDAASEVPSGLAAAGGVIAGSIALGSVTASGLLFVAPWSDGVALAVPYAAAFGVVVLQLVLTLVLMQPVGRGGRGAGVGGGWTGALRGGLGLVTGPALRWLVLAMVFVAVGVSALELLMPVRMEEFSADASSAGTVLGLVSAAAWGLGSVGALVTSRILRHRSAAPVAVVLVAVEALGLAGMAVATGPAVLVAGFWTSYVVHTAFGATYNSLVHARVDDARRGTALSMTSLVFLGTGAAAGVGLGALAERTSASTSLGLGAVSLVVAAVIIAGATRRRERGVPAAPGNRALSG